MIHLAVIAPAQAVRAGLRALLDQEPDLEVVAEAAVLLDLDIPSVDLDILVVAAEAAAQDDLAALLEELQVGVGVVLVGDDPVAWQALSGLPLRGWGLLPTDMEAEELTAAVRAVHEGLVVGASSLIEPLLERRLVLDPGAGEALVEALTGREQEVLELLADGLANKQIAVALGISEHTVKFHVSSIYAKLGATNRAEAVRLGARQGLITL